MDAPVDFSLDRARILNGNLSSSAIGSYSGGSYSEGGHVPSLNRGVGPGISATAGLSELTRVGTPASLSQEFQNRYLHPPLSVSTQGASYAAMMSNYLAGPGSEHLKPIMPDIQQYYRAHGEGLPRYMLSGFPPYFPYLPGAAESLSLFAQQNSSPTAAAYHRMYELQKEAFLYHELSGRQYGSLSPGMPSTQSSRMPTEFPSSKDSLTSGRQGESKRTVDLSKESNSRHESKRTLDLSKQCDTKKLSEFSKHQDSKRSIDPSKHSETKNSDSKEQTSQKRTIESKKQMISKRQPEASKTGETKQSGTKKKDTEKDECLELGNKSRDKASPQDCLPSPYPLTPGDQGVKAKSAEKQNTEKEHKVQDVPKRPVETNASDDGCPVKRKKPKIDKNNDTSSPSDKHKPTEKQKIIQKSEENSENGNDTQNTVIKKNGSPERVETISSSKKCLSPISVDTSNGACTDSVCTGTSEQSSTNTTFSVPYYHSVYSHSLSNGVTDRMKIRAPTFTPEIVTLPSVVSIASLPVQTMACDMTIKKDMTAYSSPKVSPTSTVNGGKCQMSPSNYDSKDTQVCSEPLALTTRESKKKEKKESKVEKLEIVRIKEKDTSKISPKSDNIAKEKESAPENSESHETKTSSSSKVEHSEKRLSSNGISTVKRKSPISILPNKHSQKTNTDHVKNTKEKGSVNVPNKTKDNVEQSNMEPSDQSSAINLTKGKDKLKNSSDPEQLTNKEAGEKEKPFYRKAEFSVVKRRPDKILAKEGSKESQRREDGSNQGMNNIPVGIAVAQKREERRSGQTETNTCSGSTNLRGAINNSSDGDGASNRLLTVTLGSTGKSVTTTSQSSDLRNQLPANLIVTGSANGSGVAWADDPSARQFSSSWLQPPQAINASPWLGQMPFSLNPSIPTSGMETGQLPLPVPPGYKLVQDSVTGQLILLPSSNFDMYDPNRLWNFSAGPGAQFQQMIAAHQSGQLPHPVYSQERQNSDYPMTIPPFQQFNQMSCSNSPVDVKPIPLLHQKTLDKLENETQTKDIKEESNQIPNEDATEKLKVDVDVESPVSVTDNSIDPKANITSSNDTKKDDVSALQSRGTSPMVPAHECEDTSQDVLEEQTKTEVSPAESPELSTKTDHNVASVQTDSVKKISNLPESTVSETSENSQNGVSIKNSDKGVSLKNSDKGVFVNDSENGVFVNGSENGVVVNDSEKKDVEVVRSVEKETPEVIKKKHLKDLPTTTVIDNVTIVEMTGPKRSLTNVPEKCEDVIPKTLTQSEVTQKDETDDKNVSNEESKENSETACVSYNPFLDPQILQAADGLELLSALAEQRSKYVESEKVDSNPIPAKEEEDKTLFNETKKETKETKTASVKPKKKSISRTRSIPPSKPSKVEKGSYYTSTGLRIPQGDEEINAIELDMRIRLAELQRQYKEKQKQLAKLQPKKDKSKEKDKDSDLSKQKGPGRPRKRKHSGPSQESSPTNSNTKTPIKRGKEAQLKKKKQAEELVDRVFRKTGGGFGMPLSKKLKANAMAALFKTQSGFTMKRKGSTSGNTPLKSGKESSFGNSSAIKSPVVKTVENKEKVKHFKYSDESSKKVCSGKGKNLFETFASSLKKSTKISRSDESTEAKKPKTESGLGILARFAASEFCGGSLTKKLKKKKVDPEAECKEGDKESECIITCNQNDSSSSLFTNHQNQFINKRDSDLDSSQDSSTSGHKKRKPGRPRKFTPDQTKNGTETIVDKHSKNFRLYQLQNFNEQWNKSPSPAPLQVPHPEKKQKVEQSQPVNKPIFLDEEWMLRRSERIFLSDPSPQPSPNFSTASTSSNKSKQSTSSTSTRKKSEDAKLQKARNIQELSQKVKKKYSIKYQRSKSTENTQTFKKQKQRVTSTRLISDSESSESEADNIPLSVLRERPTTPEPRSCAISVDELKDGLRVLVFRDGLFYEGAVKGIRPPDVYGVVVDNARGNRPYIYSREEILRDVIVDVRTSSSRFLKEGTRLCAYWSQQFSCLYPGTVAKASPNPHGDKSLINVEFDDGDSGRIPLDHIRLLPQDFPLVSYDPNPLLLIGKRRRHTTSDFPDRKPSESLENGESKSKGKRGRPPKSKVESRGKEDDDEDIDVCGLDDENDDVFSERCLSQKEQKSDQVSIHSKHSRDADKKKSKQKEKVLEYRSSESDQEQGNDKLTKLGDGQFKIPEIAYAPRSKRRRYKLLIGDKNFFDNEAYSDCRLHDQIPSLGEDSDDDGYSNEETDDDYSYHSNCHSRKTKSVASENSTAVFIPARQLWQWSGKSTKRPGMKGKAKKEYYRSIVRGNEHLSIGECAVFLSSGRPNLPFVGRIDSMWEAWGGQMVVKVKWFYHPEETKGGKKLQDMKGALFQSPHIDENDVQTISHKCDLLSYTEYRKRRNQGTLSTDRGDVYYLAGTYEPTIGLLKFEDDIM